LVEIGAEMNASARACTVTVCRIIERHGGSFTRLSSSTTPPLARTLCRVPAAGGGNADVAAARRGAPESP